MSLLVATGGTDRPIKTLVDMLQAQTDRLAANIRELDRELVAERQARQSAELEVIELRARVRELSGRP
jgi:hypothetical protein